MSKELLERYKSVYSGIQPSEALVAATKAAMLGEGKTIRRKTKRFVFAAVSSVAYIVLAVLCVRAAFFQKNAQTLLFNEIDAVYQAAPKWYPDAYTQELNSGEAKDVLRADIAACIPPSLNGYTFYAYAQYIGLDERGSVDIYVTEKSDGTGKTIFLSVANKEWSERSAVAVDYIYSGGESQSTVIGGTAVEAYVRPPVVHENADTGYYSEEDAIYIARFNINGFDYYVEGREGVTQGEFSAFVISIITSYDK